MSVNTAPSLATRLDQQTSDNISLTGGTVDGVTIGATTPKPVKATTLTATGAATISGAASTAGITDTVGLKCTANVGTPGTGVTAAEFGDGMDHTTVLTINTVLPNIPGGAALGIGDLIYTFPAGACVVNVSYMSMAITQTTGHITADTPKVGLGTVIASGAVSALSGTATFQNIITQQSAADCNGTATVTALIPTASAPFVILTAAAHTLYFNAAATWAASGDPAAVLAGTVVIQWTFLH